MDEWKPGDSGWAIGTMAGGPFDGATWGDLPIGEDGAAPWRVSVPLKGDSGPVAMYDRSLRSGDDRWLYLFVGVSAVVTDASPLPVGGSVHLTALPALRFRVAQSWWIASELVRRHASREVLEIVGAELQVVRPREGSRAAHNFCRLNRASGVMAAGLHLDWTAVLAADSPHDIVRTVERAQQRELRGRAPATTPRALTYRVAARLLATRVDDRATWDVRADEVHQLEGAEHRGFVDEFPTAVAATRSAAVGMPSRRFWGVLRNDECRAVLSDDGVLHAGGGGLDLVAAYRLRHRLQDVMAEVQEVLAR